MTDKPCCETCPHHIIVGSVPDIDECEVLDHTPTMSDKRFIKHMGCLSHPGAREWLMKDVIAYMEQFLVSNENTPFDRYEWCDRAKSAMAKEAISLIRGVKE